MGAGGVIPGSTNPLEHDLLGRLGLDERATNEDIARARNELQAFLATAPKSIRGWARTQATATDEAFALLSDPTTWHGAGALPAPRPRSATQPGGPATPPVRRATPTDVMPEASFESASSESEGDSDAEFDAMLAELTPSMHRDRFAPRSAAEAPHAASQRFVRSSSGGAPHGRRISRPLIAVAGIVVAAVVAVGVYQFGAPPASSAAQPTPSASGGLNQARVATLMAQIQTNPKDTAALLELGDAFFQAGDYSTAASWLDKVLVLEPNNTRALLALGAAQFNLGDAVKAKAQWVAVLAIDTNNVEAHYDLGFLYLNAAPPDLDGVKREWNEVVKLAPGTDTAKVVQQHLDALTSSGAPSGAPTTAPSVGASTAPSAVPSAPASAAPTAAPSGSSAP